MSFCPSVQHPAEVERGQRGLLHRQEATQSEGDQECTRPSPAPQMGELRIQHAFKSGASLPGHQAPVWLHQGALSWLGQNDAQVLTLFALSNLWMTRPRFVPIE